MFLKNHNNTLINKLNCKPTRLDTISLLFNVGRSFKFDSSFYIKLKKKILSHIINQIDK